MKKIPLPSVVLICVAVLLVITRTLVVHVLFHLRALVYEEPTLLAGALLLYVVSGTLLSLKRERVFPFFLAGFILLVVVYNVFSSYEEVLKFGISRSVFTGLVSVLFHSPVVPVVVVTARAVASSVLGVVVIGFLIFKGYILVRKWFNASPVEKVLLSSGVGFGITAFTTVILAALQLLTLRNVLLVELAFFSAVFLLPSRRFETTPIRIELSHREKQIWGLVALLFFGGFLYAALIPPLEWDTLAYQAYYANLVYKNGGIPPLFGPSIGIEMSAAYPPAYQMLGCFIYVFTGANAHFMSMVSLVCGALSVVVIFWFSTVLIPSHRTYALVFAVAVPFFLAFSASPHYMTLLIFFNALCLYYLTDYLLKGNDVSLYLSAVFLGFACLTSYLALASCLFFVVAYAVKRFPVKTAAVYAATTGVLASPPLVRNLVFTGNPLFPLFGWGRQLQNPLWVSNTVHFKIQTLYAGLKVTSSFSVLDFLMNRISSVRPLIPLLMVVGVVFIIVKRPKMDWIITWFLCSVFIFLVRPTFDRYVLIYLPVYGSFFAWIMKNAPGLLRRSLQFALAASLGIVVVGMLITGPLMVASHLKQFPDRPLDEWAYVRQFYPHDTPCWRWLNAHTPEDGYVAMYDIRYYYVDKQLFALDGLEALPLYGMEYEDALSFLREKGVIYWFSSRWTSPADETCPLAYYENPLTPYLGTDVLPLVFVSGQAAVYAVGTGRVDYQDILEKEKVLYPVNGWTYQFREGGMVYFDVPGDFHGRMVVLSFSHNVKVGMYKGHAVSPLLLGEVVESVEGDTLIVPFAGSGKYTLFIEAGEPFTLTVVIME